MSCLSWHAQHSYNLSEFVSDTSIFWIKGLTLQIKVKLARIGMKLSFSILIWRHRMCKTFTHLVPSAPVNIHIYLYIIKLINKFLINSLKQSCRKLVSSLRWHTHKWLCNVVVKFFLFVFVCGSVKIQVN